MKKETFWDDEEEENFAATNGRRKAWLRRRPREFCCDEVKENLVQCGGTWISADLDPRMRSASENNCEYAGRPRTVQADVEGPEVVICSGTLRRGETITNERKSSRYFDVLAQLSRGGAAGDEVEAAMLLLARMPASGIFQELEN